MDFIKQSVLTLSVATIFMTGCGSTTDSISGSSTVFPSDATTAEPTVENGEEVRDVVAQDQNLNLSLTSNDSQNSNIILALENIYKSIEDINGDSTVTRAVVDSGSNDCPNGGTYKYSVSGSEDDAIFSVEYDQCDMYGVFYDGAITMHEKSYDESTMSYKYSETEFVTDFTMEYNGQNMKIYKGGTMDMEVLSTDEYGSINKMKLGISMITEVGDKKSGQKDASYIVENIDSYTSSMYQTAGRIYINNLESYVDYDTSYDMSQTPFVFNNKVLVSGESHFNMDGGKLKIKVENNQARVYVDSDNDGVYELSE